MKQLTQPSPQGLLWHQRGTDLRLNPDVEILGESQRVSLTPGILPSTSGNLTPILSDQLGFIWNHVLPCIIKKQSKMIKIMEKKKMLNINDDLVLMMRTLNLGFTITTLEVKKLLNLDQT